MRLFRFKEFCKQEHVGIFSVRRAKPFFEPAPACESEVSEKFFRNGMPLFNLSSELMQMESVVGVAGHKAYCLFGISFTALPFAYINADKSTQVALRHFI